MIAFEVILCIVMSVVLLCLLVFLILILFSTHNDY